MKKIVILAMVLSILSAPCCAVKEIVKTDLNSFNQDPEQYKDKRVIITTEIESILKDPTSFIKRDIEISGLVRRNPRGFEWGFSIRDEKGNSLECYETEYRISPWLRVDQAIKRAELKKEKVTVVGKLGTGLQIELDWIEYEGDVMDTDFKPNTGFYWLRW